MSFSVDFEKIIDHLVDTGTLTSTGEASSDGSPYYRYVVQESRDGLLELFGMFADNEKTIKSLQEQTEDHFDLEPGTLDGFF